MQERRRNHTLFAQAMLGGTVALCLQTGCATTDAASPGAEAASTAAKAQPADRTQEVAARLSYVEDAFASGQIKKARVDLAASDSMADRFGRVWATADEQERWNDFRGLLKQNSQDPVGHLGLCLTYAQWKMRDQMVKPCAQTVQTLGENALVDLARGRLAAGRGDLPGAKQQFAAALNKYPGFTAARLELAAIATREGDQAAAAGLMREAAKLDPSSFLAALGAAKAAEAMGDRDAARPYWVQARALAPSRLDVLEGFAAVMVGHDDKTAYAGYKDAVKAHPKRMDLVLAAALLAEKTGDLPGAVALNTTLTTANKDDKAAWQRLDALALKMGTSRLVPLAALTRLNPENLHLQHALGVAAGEAEAYTQAIWAFHAVEDAVKAGKVGDFTAEDAAAAERTYRNLRGRLKITGKLTKGDVNTVVGTAEWLAGELYKIRRAKKQTGSGQVTLRVTTNKFGKPVAVEFEEDTLNDEWVRASILGNYLRSRIWGGAKAYTVVLQFE